jgi:hypothetical protein
MPSPRIVHRALAVLLIAFVFGAACSSSSAGSPRHAVDVAHSLVRAGYDNPADICDAGDVGSQAARSSNLRFAVSGADFQCSVPAKGDIAHVVEFDTRDHASAYAAEIMAGAGPGPAVSCGLWEFDVFTTSFTQNVPTTDEMQGWLSDAVRGCGPSNKNNSAASSSMTVAPTPTPPTTVSEDSYKSSAQQVTISQLVNNPLNYDGSAVTFTGTVVNFLQDSSGATTAMNVNDPNDITSIVYVQFSPTADPTQMNKNDSVQIWGDGIGTTQGPNAFGATVNVSSVQERYLTDTSTNYNDHG